MGEHLYVPGGTAVPAGMAKDLARRLAWDDLAEEMASE
jgi:hypothetical protein